MRDIWGTICMGGVCLSPLFAFALGLAIGSRRIRLPYRVIRVEESNEYAVEES